MFEKKQHKQTIVIKLICRCCHSCISTKHSWATEYDAKRSACNAVCPDINYSVHL